MAWSLLVWPMTKRAVSLVRMEGSDWSVVSRQSSVRSCVRAFVTGWPSPRRLWAAPLSQPLGEGKVRTEAGGDGEAFLDPASDLTRLLRQPPSPSRRGLGAGVEQFADRGAGDLAVVGDEVAAEDGVGDAGVEGAVGVGAVGVAVVEL